MAKQLNSRELLYRDLEKFRQSWSSRTRQARAKAAIERQQKLFQLIGGDAVGH